MASVTMLLQIGKRNFKLDENHLNKILKAHSAREAYATQDGQFLTTLFDRFCLGKNRKILRELFWAIAGAQCNTDPISLLQRFQKLSSFIDTEHAGQFTGYAAFSPNGRSWQYTLTIMNTLIFKSDPITESVETHKPFLLALTAWNIQQEVAKLNVCQCGKEHYVKTQIKYIADIKYLEQGGLDEESYRIYLKSSLFDPRFCRTNFKKIREVSDDMSVFDAIFVCDDQELILRLNHCNSKIMNFRNATVKQAIQLAAYNNLYELFSDGYGTAEADFELRYIVDKHKRALMVLMGEDFLSTSQEIFSKTMVTRLDAEPVSVWQLLSTLEYDER